MIPLELRKPLGSVVVSLSIFVLWKLSVLICHRLTSPLRRLRGPESRHWFYGNMMEFLSSQENIAQIWTKQYGSTLSFYGFFSDNWLLTTDTRTIHHVLTHSHDFERPFQSRYNLACVVGKGLLIVEGHQHQQQRHIMNPAFGPGQIRALTDIFVAKATRLRDILMSEITKNPSATVASTTHIDIVPWLNKMTLDVIGLAGFNYNFDALDQGGKPNELDEAFASMFSALFSETRSSRIFPRSQMFIPPLRLVPTDSSRKIREGLRTVMRIGHELLADAKMAARANATENGEIEKSSIQGRDLFSLLVKANMATDVPDGQRLSDKDVLAQVPTFLVAGHESTSTAVMWALFAMSQARLVQDKLRDELLSIDTETPTMDHLAALPYLDAIVRETLRLHAPVVMVSRKVMKDQVLPVEQPFKDRYGTMHDTIRISKGDSIAIPILAINRSEELWGHDANEFKPERWESVPAAVLQIPGVWGHLLTFLSGPRACIGFRFSLIEIKAILFFLVRAFKFELAVPAGEIETKMVLVQQPILRGDTNKRVQLPLVFKLYQRS